MTFLPFCESDCPFMPARADEGPPVVTQLSGKTRSARSVRSVLPLPATATRREITAGSLARGLAVRTLVAAEQQQEGDVGVLLEHVQEELI